MSLFLAEVYYNIYNIHSCGESYDLEISKILLLCQVCVLHIKKPVPKLYRVGTYTFAFR